MKYLEVSKKIKLTKTATQADIRNALIKRLDKAFRVQKVNKNKAGFSLVGNTGGPKSLVRYAHVNLDVKVIKDKTTMRILATGHSKMAFSLLLSYTALFLLILFAGLLPGSIETSGESSGAMDALVLMIFGIFIFYDINKKIAEPEQYLEAALKSLDVEYG